MQQKRLLEQQHTKVTGANVTTSSAGTTVVVNSPAVTKVRLVCILMFAIKSPKCVVHMVIIMFFLIVT